MEQLTTLAAVTDAERVLVHLDDWRLYEVVETGTDKHGAFVQLSPVSHAGFFCPTYGHRHYPESDTWATGLNDRFAYHGPVAPKDVGTREYPKLKLGEHEGALVDDWDGESVMVVGPDLAGFAKVTLVVDKHEDWGYTGNPDKAKLHRSGPNGTPLCGTTLRAYKVNPDRWNPWNKYSVPADTRESRYVPVFGLGLDIDKARTEQRDTREPWRKPRALPSPCGKCRLANTGGLLAADQA